MERKSSQPLEVFYCYAREDRAFCEELNKHLAGLLRSGLITVWFDGDISPGTLWEREIKAHLNTARLILLLVSPDFLSSDYCYGEEMVRALQRHHAKEALVIPVFLRSVVWASTPFSMLQGLPSNARPITSWPNRDEAFADVVRGIHRVVEDFLKQQDTSNHQQYQFASRVVPHHRSAFSQKLSVPVSTPSLLHHLPTLGVGQELSQSRTSQRIDCTGSEEPGFFCREHCRGDSYGVAGSTAEGAA